ncbi:LLM class flavin-dependent oxidoreductase [Mucilaginibacter sp. E4BP6]|uniref:LLM class flavin-dependent oxidoreductase n=1 Tax=Mucilaginibacter sp. E4BP6 TaxID=2723089 RepID=UPI0015CC71A8|nr:LLM class flavin-dependent oxidoreductase [Mucilaginibacter sp. E4BP6]NYE67038.1 FMN-dependent oxidoreductase (nitrilotriacetate monooxygenase family) [Mucilaginibacter sp. E4BP6]
MENNHLILTAFFFNPQGDNRVSWRYPSAAGKEIFDLEYYKKLVLAAEDACIDAIFLADHVGIWDSFPSNIPSYANARLEPITLLAALSAVTKNIGLISTVSASYSLPYNLARSFASLDHLSHGRSGWNVVTSGMDEEARNFGRDASIEHSNRYSRAAEYITLAKELWDSWEDEAILMDKASGIFADKDKVHHLNFEGEFFKVRGPLNVPRPVQGYPVIVQAGGSDDGRNLAAKHADLNFALLRSIKEGQEYREDFNRRLEKFGRPASALKILPGILPIVASSMDEAAEKEALLEKLVPEQVGIDLVSYWVGMDLSGYPIDGPIPALPDEASFNGQRTNLVKVKQYQSEGLTIREVAKLVANVGTAPTIKGTPKQIADQLEEWFTAKAADGFNLMFPTIPEEWMNFMRDVIPELRRRNLVPSQYAPGTLRDRLNLPRPVNQFSK